MNNKSVLTLSEQTKNEIAEISALSGYSQSIIKEVYEYMLINWAIKLSDTPDDFVELNIPYIGTLGIKYLNDIVLSSGELGTNVDTYLNVDDSFKKLVGDIHDEGYTEIVPLMLKKIEQAIMVASSVD